MSLQFDGHAISNQKLKLMSGSGQRSRPAVAAPLAQAAGSRVTGRLSRLTQSHVPGLRFRRDARSLVESET